MNVAVVILNTNAWADTIECLETLFRSTHSTYSVIVCDNDSHDGSLEKIKAWAEGRLSPWTPPGNPLRELSCPGAQKPIAYREYGRESAEWGGDPAVVVPLTLIRNGGNLGFAGGSNIGLRYVLRRRGFDCVWLLNPDTVVRPDTMSHLVAKFEEDPSLGICGSTVLYYHAPDTVQVLGGARYNRWIALPLPIGTGRAASEPIDAEQITSTMTYVYGASMMISNAFLDEVGLLCEDYFLYFDELDWAMRAKGKYRLAYAPESVVYHREGGTIGSGLKARKKSWTADYYFIRNRILFTRKFVPAALPTVYLALVVAMLRRASRGQWDRVGMIAKLCLSV
jgi:GT2 family glycosyltransferase